MMPNLTHPSSRALGAGRTAATGFLVCAACLAIGACSSKPAAPPAAPVHHGPRPMPPGAGLHPGQLLPNGKRVTLPQAAGGGPPRKPGATGRKRPPMPGNAGVRPGAVMPNGKRFTLPRAAGAGSGSGKPGFMGAVPGQAGRTGSKPPAGAPAASGTSGQ
ncbi:MAG: hypothetical protein KGJ62_01935 [Armatimonadetes bacterium]|nr:hypothetical protein [Armatimonadota bacterium]MDE2206730.1 hypothetical protein [Armatimonadota bacterium]